MKKLMYGVIIAGFRSININIERLIQITRRDGGRADKMVPQPVMQL